MHTWKEVHDWMNLIPSDAIGRNDPPRSNITPTQDVGFLTNSEDGFVVKDGRWWLVPFWAKEMPNYPMFNARSETMREKPSFREAFKSKRCLIPASGYYEWTKGDDGGKDPHYIHLPENQPMCFAGLWAHNENLDITSCTIVTAQAVPEISDLHHRMPVILDENVYEQWLIGSPDEAFDVISENLGNKLVSHRVDRAVNSNKAKGAALIEPIK